MPQSPDIPARLPRLRILVPAHNESSRISAMLADYCETFGEDAIVTVIANACTDDTTVVITRLMDTYSNLQMIVVNGRIGKGGAIRAGFKTGDENYIGFADADGSTSAQEFNRLFNECLARNVDGVIASRWSKGAAVFPRQSALRRLASRTFNVIVRLLFGLPYTDTQCGAKIFRRDAVEGVLWHLDLANFAFDIDLLYQLRQSGKRIIETPTAWSDTSGSKVRLLPASLSMLSSIVRLRLLNSRARVVPFIEYIGRGNAIPVRKPPRLLILNRRSDAVNLHVRRCLEGSISAWKVAGIRVEWLDDVLPPRDANSPFKCLLDRLALLHWYVFGTDRPYDALIEMATDFPSLIPLFTVKPAFLLRYSAEPASAIVALYRSSELNVDENSTWEEIARAILGGAQRSPYEAVFFEKDATWALRFSDLESGLPRQTELK